MEFRENKEQPIAEKQLPKISQKYPGEKGAHIGGIDHLNTKCSKKPLQSLIDKMGAEVFVNSFSV